MLGDLLNQFIIPIAIIGVIVLLIIVAGILKRYRRCPADKVMVIYGKVGRGSDGESRSSKCIHGGAAFIWPIFQECQFLDLTPFSMNIDLRNALSKQNIRVNVPSSFTVEPDSSRISVRFALMSLRPIFLSSRPTFCETASINLSRCVLAISAEKEAECLQRAAIANANSQAIDAENKAATAIAISAADRREAEAQASARAYSAEKVRNAIALSEAYAAEEKAELARAARQQATMNADVIVKAEIEKKRIEIAAEAEAEAIRRKAKGEADAMLAQMQAQAEGIKAQLAKRAEGFTLLVKSSNNDPNAAVKLMMTDKIDDLLKIQVEAIKDIKIDKITVWDSMNGENGTSTTAGFLKSMLKSIPPMQDVFNMIDLDLPANLAKPADPTEAPKSEVAKPRFSLNATKSVADSSAAH